MIAISEFLADEIDLLRYKMYLIYSLTGTFTDRMLLRISKQLDSKINVQQRLMVLAKHNRKESALVRERFLLKQLAFQQYYLSPSRKQFGCQRSIVKTNGDRINNNNNGYP